MQHFFLPSNLKKIRRKWKFAQEYFAELMQVNRGKMSQYEIGRAKPNIFFIARLQNLTNININDLMYTDLKEHEIPREPLQDNIYQFQPEGDYKEVPVKDGEMVYGFSKTFMNILMRLEKLEAWKDKIEKQ